MILAGVLINLNIIIDLIDRSQKDDRIYAANQQGKEGDAQEEDEDGEGFLLWSADASVEDIAVMVVFLDADLAEYAMVHLVCFVVLAIYTVLFAVSLVFFLAYLG